MQNYQDLKVWHKAHAILLAIYETTRLFPKEEIYGLTSQIRRSAVSIPANLAEGCGKNSKLDTANFFQIALGSLPDHWTFVISTEEKSLLVV